MGLFTDMHALAEEDKKIQARKRYRKKGREAQSRYILARSMNGVGSVTILVPEKDREKFHAAAKLSRDANVRTLAYHMKPADILRNELMDQDMMLEEPTEI